MMRWCVFSLLLSLCFVYIAQVDGFSFDEDILPEEVAIVQFDSRPPSSYWETAAKWNNRYCLNHGHKFLYYTSRESCRYDSTVLADPWCKVLSMIQATHDHPKIKVFIYMDSDAVVDQEFFQLSLLNILEIARVKLNWDVIEKPILFNQDGPCWWCNLIEQAGYKMCLNAGTVAWVRHPTSMEVLQKWWHSTQDSYDTNPLKRKFRTSWPWEQDRQMAIYNSTSDKIQISSQPENAFMQREKGSQAIKGGWCLSHLPKAGCFISHFCANKASKAAMQRKYTDYLLDPNFLPKRAAVTSGRELDEIPQYYLKF